MSKKNIPKDVWKRIDEKGEDECWKWIGQKDKNGYGWMKINNKNYYVHRIVYGLTYGEIPFGLYVLHKCDTPKCCNPTHLFLGTLQDNMKDRDDKGRCSAGEKQGCHKLTDIQILDIRKKYQLGTYSQRDLAKEYNVSQVSINYIINRKTWRYI